jgi:hypothetical protein
MRRRIRYNRTMKKQSSTPCLHRLTACALGRISVRSPHPAPQQTAHKKRETTKNAAEPAQ